MKIFSRCRVANSAILVIVGGEEPEEINCSCCYNSLADGEFITALGQKYHIDCFRCSSCDCLMYSSSFYFEKNGLLFCKSCYWVKFGECCHSCDKLVSGPVMICGEIRYHPE